MTIEMPDEGLTTRDATLHWQGYMNNLNTTLRQSEVQNLEQLTQLMNESTLTAYQSKPASSSTQDHGILHQKWQHFRAAKASSGSSLSVKTLFHKWLHFVKFKILDKHHARQVKLNQRRKINDMLDEAHVAHYHHDSYQLFKIVNKYCPKQRLKRIRLKSDQGHFLTPVDETAENCQYISENWSGPQLRIPFSNPPGVNFTLGELEAAIEQIPGTKAVAPIFDPGVVWKSQACFLAPWIYKKLHEWWNQSPPHIIQVCLPT